MLELQLRFFEGNKQKTVCTSCPYNFTEDDLMTILKKTVDRFYIEEINLNFKYRIFDYYIVSPVLDIFVICIRSDLDLIKIKEMQNFAYVEKFFTLFIEEIFPLKLEWLS